MLPPGKYYPVGAGFPEPELVVNASISMVWVLAVKTIPQVDPGFLEKEEW